MKRVTHTHTPHTHTTHTHTHTHTKSGESQLSAGHIGIIGRPQVITDSAPRLSVAHLYTSLPWYCTTSQSDVPIIANSCRQMHQNHHIKKVLLAELVATKVRSSQELAQADSTELLHLWSVGTEEKIHRHI